MLLPIDFHPALPNLFQAGRIQGPGTGHSSIQSEMLYISVRDLVFFSRLHLIQHQSGLDVRSFMNASHTRNLLKNVCWPAGHGTCV